VHWAERVVRTEGVGLGVAHEAQLPHRLLLIGLDEARWGGHCRGAARKRARVDRREGAGSNLSNLV
jgi:hypothetical protein